MSEGVARAQRRLGPPFTAPEGQRATFVELFFDLVLVFALTQVTALTLAHLAWDGATRPLPTFWLIRRPCGRWSGWRRWRG